MSEPADLTQLLNAWSSGDVDAGDALMRSLYRELHALSRARLRNFGGDLTLQATELVHDAFLRLCDQQQKNWSNRAHFLAIASVVMRRVLLDHARRRTAEMRDRSLETALDEAALFTPERAEELIELDEAMSQLAQFDPRAARVVEFRYFGGMNIEEIALALDISPATVKRDWTLARAWLYKRLG